MKEKQTTKGNIALTEKQRNRKENTSNRAVSRKDNKKSKVKKPVRVKASRKEEEIKLPAEFLKKMRTLRAICKKIDKLEKQKRKIILSVLNEKEKSS